MTKLSKSETLTAELTHNDYLFSITFESESPIDNMLMSITFHGKDFTIPVDTSELYISNDKDHEIFYQKIIDTMLETAKIYWKDQAARESKYGKLPNMVTMAENFFNKIKTLLR